jgi:hypothetical protein
MNIEQRSTNKLVRSPDRGDLVVAAGPQELARPTQSGEWDLRKVVFITLISVGYGCAAWAFWLMFSAVHPL